MPRGFRSGGEEREGGGEVNLPHGVVVCPKAEIKISFEKKLYWEGEKGG